MRSLLASRTAWAERSRSSSLSQTQAACARGPLAAGAHPAAGDGVLLAGYLPATPPARAAEPRTRTTRQRRAVQVIARRRLQTYLTVRVPCMPASRWPGTVQKKV